MRHQPERLKPLLPLELLDELDEELLEELRLLKLLALDDNELLVEELQLLRSRSRLRFSTAISASIFRRLASRSTCSMAACAAIAAMRLNSNTVE